MKINVREMNSITVTIIIPIYNVEDYIIPCLRSVASQDYNGKIECILIDDCGQDRSINLAKEFVKSYSGSINFKLVHHLANKGLSEARNTGTLEASNDYLYYLDSDDEIKNDCISSMVELVVKYPDIEVVQGGCLCIENGKYWNKLPWYNFENRKNIEYISNHQIIKRLLLNSEGFPVTAWNKLLKKEFIIGNNLFFKKGIIHEDELWCYFLSKHVHSIAFVNKNTMIHYVHEGSIMRTKQIRSFRSWCIIWQDMIDNIDDFCRAEQVKRILLSTTSWYIFDEDVAKRKEVYGVIKSMKDEIPLELFLLYWSYRLLPNLILRRQFVYRFFCANYSNHTSSEIK